MARSAAVRLSNMMDETNSPSLHFPRSVTNVRALRNTAYVITPPADGAKCRGNRRLCRHEQSQAPGVVCLGFSNPPRRSALHLLTEFGRYCDTIRMAWQHTQSRENSAKSSLARSGLGIRTACGLPSWRSPWHSRESCSGWAGARSGQIRGLIRDRRSGVLHFPWILRGCSG